MKNLPIPFDQLPESATKRYQFNKTDVLFQQGDPVSHLFYLESGEVVLSRFGLNGDEVVIHLAQSKQTFAEASLFSDIYHCTATVTSPTWLWKIDKLATLSYAENNPAFSMSLMACFAEQIQQLRSQKELLVIRSAQTRVYAAINQGLLNTSVKQFANTIGLTHEAVYRSLASLAKEGKIIKTGRGQYQLHEQGTL